MESNAEFITADDGVRLYVETIGTGEDAVIIPNRVFMAEAFARLAEHRTVIFSDPRNRGRSETITDHTRLARGVHHDVDDFDAIRRHFGLHRVNLIGHSYMGVVVILFALKYPDLTNRVVQIGPMGPEYAKRYPPTLANEDATYTEVLTSLGELQKRRASYAAEAFCKEFWTVLRPLYVVDRKDADRLGWEPCDLPNEMAFMKQFTQHVLPSMAQLQMTADDLAKIRAPVLGIHGRSDRSSPYGAGRDWALRLPNARLLTVDDAAHVPWIEEPEIVFSAIETFLGGQWPDGVEKVDSLAQAGEPA
jgi:proline iminopeptidase